jgi:hypothetical protein
MVEIRVFDFCSFRITGLDWKLLGIGWVMTFGLTNRDSGFDAEREGKAEKFAGTEAGEAGGAKRGAIWPEAATTAPPGGCQDWADAE